MYYSVRLIQFAFYLYACLGLTTGPIQSLRDIQLSVTTLVMLHFRLSSQAWPEPEETMSEFFGFLAADQIRDIINKHKATPFPIGIVGAFEVACGPGSGRTRHCRCRCRDHFQVEDE